MTDTVKVGRLAMRHEGNNWNAYYALPGTMTGAIPLGSIAMRGIVANAERKQAFMDMMKDMVADIIKEETGASATWPEGPQPAPEGERSGHA